MAYSDLSPARLPPSLERHPLLHTHRLLSKPGVRGFPGLDPAQALLMEVLLAPPLPLEGPLLDLSAMSGVSGVLLAEHEPTLLERSRAALSVLEAQNFERVLRGTPAELEGEYGTVIAVLPAERGNEAVQETVHAAYRLTRAGGTCYLAGDKDRGFERYFKWARANFGEGEVLERAKGLRVAGFRKIRTEAQEGGLNFGAYPLGPLKIATLPGVFSARGLDAASALLLEHLPDPGGLRVLDLGAGAGVLSAWAAAGGAQVTALEDDWGAVLCTRETLGQNGLAGEVLHSDVGSALPDEARFDLAVTNPPFHVGSDLILEVAEAFIETAAHHLRPGGNLFLVANVFLAYEPILARHFRLREVVRTRSFKVLAGQKR